MIRRVAVTAVLLLVAACGSDDSDGSTGRDLTVSAAASLTDVLTGLQPGFEENHDGLRLRLNFGGSAQLAEQIVAGAPVDVFAAASPATMRTVTDADAAQGTPAVFARNSLQIAVPRGNPAGITGLADFARADLTLAVCAEKVPCGAAAATVFDNAGITAEPDTLESDVRAVLTKVELGEVDAGLVYRTDVLAAGEDVGGIDFPEADTAINEYLVVAVSDSEDAAAFVAMLTSADGQAALEQAGFLGADGR